MSFLDILSRATDSPATDYHICIFNNPNYRDEVYDFFFAPKVFEIIQEINSLETHLCVLDKKRGFTKHQFTENEGPILANFEEWSLTHERWRSCKAEFKELLGDFQSQKLSEENNLSVEKAEIDNEVQDSSDNGNDKKQSTPKQSASDFLLSMAGIFDSGLKDTSENVEAIVVNSVLKKHERE